MKRSMSTLRFVKAIHLYLPYPLALLDLRELVGHKDFRATDSLPGKIRLISTLALVQGGGHGLADSSAMRYGLAHALQQHGCQHLMQSYITSAMGLGTGGMILHHHLFSLLSVASLCAVQVHN